MSGTKLTEDELASYILCVARSKRSPDMQGYAVRLSAFVANICIAILIKFSEKPVEESVGVLVLQVSSIHFSTVAAMYREELSVSDAHFALSLTMSPLSFYLVYSACRFFINYNTKNYLYSRIKRSQKARALFSVYMVVGWVAIKVMVYSKDDDCKVTSYAYLTYEVIAVAWTFLFSAALIGILPLVWVVYLFRHWRDIRGEYRRHMEKPASSPGWKIFRWIWVIGRSAKVLVLSQWVVITTSHRWLSFYVVLIFYVTWGGALVIWAVDMQKWFYEVIAVTFTSLTQKYVAPDDFDPLSYGQLLAITVAIQPAWAVCKLVWRRRMGIRDWLLDWPESLGHGIVFMITGRGNPWEKHLKSQPYETPQDRSTGGPSDQEEMEGYIRVSISSSRGDDDLWPRDGYLLTTTALPPGLAVTLPPQSYIMYRQQVHHYQSQELFSLSYPSYQPPAFDGSHPYSRYGQDMV